VVRSRQALIDRFGELDRQLSANELEMAPIHEEHEKLKQEITAWANEHPADRCLTASGVQYILEIGARRNERTIIKPLACFRYLQKQMGLASLVGVIDIPLGTVVDKFIPKSAQKAFVVEERAGSRKITCVAKVPASKAA
jgi:hypothetical protein